MKWFVTFLALLSIHSHVLSKDVPHLSSAIVDQAGLLSSRAENVLSEALFQVKRETGNEIAVLTINSLEDESLEGYSIKVADSWKLGQKGQDNGVLLLISVDDKKMRIEVGKGLEGKLPDITSGRILSSIGHYFKQGDYQSGIFLGISQIVEKTGGTLRNIPRVRNRRSRGPFAGLVFFGFILFLSLFAKGRGLLSILFLTSVAGSHRRGGGYSRGGGFGGGGFGGGGGFSGGGASGGW